MAVSMSMVVTMTMTVMIVSMAMSVTMIMAAMSVSVVERENSDQVDQQADKTDQQQSMRVHLWRIQQSLNGFRNDTDRDQYQEHSVCESAQRFHPIVPEKGKPESVS
ncbi:hypothetical protein INT43_005291 [Umbelopsis isabellina]|uniref:Uncharacterized protein n=1 Tax=Mortierella isabellina TaxID=91625 RepID=A0A8H7U7D6_MORIS|nr:hypothetical protein INT43_005291 [Umbelopsis isabellina]